MPTITEPSLLVTRPRPRVVHVDFEDFDIYIGRNPDYGDTKWGNPFRIGRDGDRATVIRKYRMWISNQDRLMDEIWELADKILGCHCAPHACHGDVLLVMANPRLKNYVGF